MSIEQCAEYLRQYNAWRRGDDSYPIPVPKALGEIIDAAIEYLTASNRINGYKPWPATHIKTGNEYQVIGEAIDCTTNDEKMVVIYQRGDMVFVRDAEQFQEKFKAKEQK